MKKSNLELDKKINDICENIMKYSKPFSPVASSVVIEDLITRGLTLFRQNHFNQIEEKFTNFSQVGKLRGNLKKEITFKNCIFTSFKIKSDVNIKINFIDCIFKGLMPLESYTDTNLQLSVRNCTIDYLQFNHMNFLKRIKVISCKIKIFEIYDTVFTDKFEFKYNTIEDSNRIHNTNFNSSVDFYRTCFTKAISPEYTENNRKNSRGSIIFRKLTFSEMTIFENCIFKEKAEYEYCTFKEHTTFRGTLFKKGLKLDRTNWNVQPNFHNAKVQQNGSTRETFRIIKNSYESNGNKIEANVYHRYELNKRRLELQKEFTFKKIMNSKYLFDLLGFYAQYTVSRHGQNWGLTLYWILIVSLLFSGFAYNKNAEYQVMPFLTVLIGIVFYHFKVSLGWFKYIASLLLASIFYGMYNDYSIEPFSQFVNIIKFNETTSPLWLTFNKVIIAYLYYQLIISTRNDMRR